MPSIPALRRQSGLSLIELMIASVIGLLLLGGLSLIFVNSSETNREMQKTSQQIENGRYAIDILSQNLRLAGFYGHLHELGSIPSLATTPPDPCETTAAALLSALSFPVQAYPGTIDATDPADDAVADVSTTSCAALTAANLKPGSDVLVIRRADTNALPRPGTATANTTYIQSSGSQAAIQIPTADVTLDDTNNAMGTAPTMFQRDGKGSPIRRFHVHIYFVAPCSTGTDTVSGVAGVCKTGDDSIPTLKRLELSAAGSFTIVPLVEGIDYLRIEYGFDTLPTDVNLSTGSAGDAAVDGYLTVPADWRTTIAAKVYLLARNTVVTRGFKDDKTYRLGSADLPPRNDEFKRHVYAAAVRLTNPAGRREIP